MPPTLQTPSWDDSLPTSPSLFGFAVPRPARAEAFDPSEVCLVHVVQRCVRRAFLAGVDPVSGNDYDFRREWIRRRMEALASVFAVDVLTYAVMSNHIHQVLRNRPDVVAEWSDQEVALRWLRVFPGRRLDEHLAEPSDQDVKTLANNAERIKELRSRLADISWFMRALCEPIARLANKQDDCTGRFWEGRFKAQRIVDEAGLLACSLYVDLNPVRAAMAESIYQCVHTGAYDRMQSESGETIASAAFDLKVVTREEAATEIRDTPAEELRDKRRKQRRSPTGRRVRRDAWLSPLRMKRQALSSDAEVHTGGLRSSDKGFLNLSPKDYFGLLGWLSLPTGTQIPDSVAAVLKSLGMSGEVWRDLVTNFRRYFGGSLIGGGGSMSNHAASIGRSYARGQRRVAELLG